MIIGADIGNSHIVIGILKEKKIVHTMRFSTDKNKTSDEYYLNIRAFLAFYDYRLDQIEGSIISSVVPSLTDVFRTVMSRLTQNNLVVGPGIKTGLNIRVDIPSSLGADLVVTAVAALEEYKQRPLLILDMGTATTLSVIDDNSNFIGGLILPGMKLSIEALATRTSQLPFVELIAPPKVVGKNTNDCMRSGAVYGQAAMIDGLIDRVEEELGKSAHTVVTGGIVGTIVPHLKHQVSHDDNLIMKGLALLYYKNQEEKHEA